MLKVKFLPFLLLSHSLLAEPLLNEHITDQDIVQILNLPSNERLGRLREIPEIRDRLKAFTFDSGRNLDVRWRSLVALGALSAKSYRWEIEEALKSKEWFLRNAGLIAVLHDDREVAISWSKKLLSDPALVVRTQAVKNLIELKANAKEEVWAALFAKNNFHSGEGLWIRGYLAEALSGWASRTDEKRFLRLLMDEDPTVQKWAILGLERATGIKVSSPSEPISIQKQKWLSRLSSEQI